MTISQMPAAAPIIQVTLSTSDDRGEDGEPEVVHADPAVDVAQAAEAHHQHARDDQEAEDHPQQVEGVRRLQRVEVDAAEDVGQGDEHDRPSIVAISMPSVVLNSAIHR